MARGCRVGVLGACRVGRWLGSVGVSLAAFGCFVVAPPLAVVRAVGRFPCCACVSVGGRLSVFFLLFVASDACCICAHWAAASDGRLAVQAVP